MEREFVPNEERSGRTKIHLPQRRVRSDVITSIAPKGNLEARRKTLQAALASKPAGLCRRFLTELSSR